MPVDVKEADRVLGLSPEDALKEFLTEMRKLGDWPLYDDFYMECVAKHPDPLVVKLSGLYFRRQREADDTALLDTLEEVEKQYPANG